MYRLVGLKSIRNPGLFISKQKFVETKTKNFHSLISKQNSFLRPSEDYARKIIFASSTIPAELGPLFKKKQKKKKKYTDVLEVTSESTTQTKRVVQKLKAKDISNFIAETHPFKSQNITISKELSVDKQNSPALFESDEISELKLSSSELIHSSQVFKDAEEEIEGAEILEEVDGIVEEIGVGHEKTKKQLEKAQAELESLSKLTTAQRKAKQKALNLSVRSYVDSCVHNGMVNRGYLTLIRYRWKHKKSSPEVQEIFNVNDVNIFNQLMFGYAEKENYQKVQEIYTLLIEDSIKPSYNTYAVKLDCLGRLVNNPDARKKNLIHSDDEMIDAIQKVISEMKNNDMTFDAIMNNSIFVKNQKENFLAAIHKVDPSYKPKYKEINILYKNSMLDSLNENVKDLSHNPLANPNDKWHGSEIMNSKAGFTKEQLDAWTREQILTELNGEMTFKSCLNHPIPTNDVLTYRKRLAEIQKRWRDTIISSFNRSIHILRMEEQRTRGNQNLLPYIRSLEVKQYVNIILSEVRKLAEGSESFSPHLGFLYRQLGEKIELRFNTEQKMKLGVLEKTNEIYDKYCDVLIAGNSSDNPRQCWQRLIYQSTHEGASVDFSPSVWPVSIRMAVGNFLYNIIIKDLKLDLQYIKTGKHGHFESFIPAFFTIFRHHGKVVKEELKPHPLLIKLFRLTQPEEITLDVNYIPMVCPPKPYWSANNGGYLVAKTELLRLPQGSFHQNSIIARTPVQNIYPILDALNQQQSIPWRINTTILDIVLEIFRKGGDNKLEIPELPTNYEPPPQPENKTLTNEDKFRLFREKLSHQKLQNELYSLWCDAHYRLSLANHFRDRPFWLPLNIDFRGRAYALPPHLTHLGADLARSLMMFYQKKKLGVDGLSWLKLHCINMTGLKKRDSASERLLFAEEVIDEIFDSADKPLDGRRWWAQSEEPWQTLAVCKEIANAIRSGDPENYECCIPVHQDGTCNGLQHYAALGRDSLGAMSVNLAPADKPQDVYSDVLQLVEQAREKDEKNNVAVAKVLKNFIKRKVIKQTVMTTVYGVTKYGARLQIAKQLKDIEDFPQEWAWNASAYLANKTFESIREMFNSTKEIQDWFFESARLISSVCQDNVEWVTPLGLPVVQPYSNTRVKMSNMKKICSDVLVDETKNPNSLKQRNAFPPNFIHSLDACHMMLTSIHCEKMGLTFASVHDCFWTHASTVPDMSRICREQFVALHSQPILEDLSKFLVKKYSFKKKELANDGSVADLTKLKLNRIITKVPKKGDFDLDKVLESTYFFS